jgi:N-acetylglucosamine-6-phosphate deacetylase
MGSDRLWTGRGPIAPGWIEVQEGRITAAGQGSSVRPVDIDLTGRLVVPGFVDIHNHGGGGAGFQDGRAGAVATAADLHRRHGTTTVLASLISAPVDELVTSLEALAPLVGAGTVAGVHLEGPFLSARRGGAHEPGHLRPPRPEDLDRLLSVGPGVVRMMTVAPELTGGLAAIRRLVAAGVAAAVGHTDASYETVIAAIDAGATVASHLGNAMRPIHHRDPGPILACLADRRVAVELIADGIHLHDAVLRHFATVAGPGRTILVTDAIPAAGIGDGDYQLGSRRLVVRDGAARLAADLSADSSSGPPARHASAGPLAGDPSTAPLPGYSAGPLAGGPTAGAGPLAGSVLTLDVALAHAVGAGIPLLDALAAVTTAPAAAVGLAGQAGTLAVGRRPDLVVLDDDLRVRGVLSAGRWLDDADSAS